MSVPSADAVGILDGLVARVLETYPYRFTMPTAEAERAVAYRIRAAVVADAGWLGHDLPNGQERDEFDDSAVQIIGWDGPEPICTGRLVLPPRDLPTERACSIVVEPRGRVVDVGRMAVLPARRTVEHAVFVALLCRLYLEMRTRGFTVACGMMSRPARRVMRLLGLDLVELGDDRMYCGELRAPVRFELLANVPSVTQRWH